MLDSILLECNSEGIRYGGEELSIARLRVGKLKVRLLLDSHHFRQDAGKCCYDLWKIRWIPDRHQFADW